MPLNRPLRTDSRDRRTHARFTGGSTQPVPCHGSSRPRPAKHAGDRCSVRAPADRQQARCRAHPHRHPPSMNQDHSIPKSRSEQSTRRPSEATFRIAGQSLDHPKRSRGQDRCCPVLPKVANVKLRLRVILRGSELPCESLPGIGRSGFRADRIRRHGRHARSTIDDRRHAKTWTTPSTWTAQKRSQRFRYGSANSW
jgi:hypothetical protein